MSTKSSREVDFFELLLDAETGFKGKFCDLLCQQFTNECVTFTRRVLACVEQQNDNNNNTIDSTTTNNNTVSVSTATASLTKIRGAIEVADPNKPRNEVNKLLARGCALSVEEVLLVEARGAPVSIEAFNRRLKRSGVLRMSAGKSRGEA